MTSGRDGSTRDVLLHLFTYVCVRGYTHAFDHVWGAEDNLWSEFFPLTMWDLGLELWSGGLTAGVFP